MPWIGRGRLLCCVHRKAFYLLPFLAIACSDTAETTTPHVGPITESVYANGLVKAEGQYMVYPTVSGTVLALLVAEGDTVKAGQALVSIDDRTSSLAQRSAISQVRLLEQQARENGPVLGQLTDAVQQARARYEVDSVNYTRQQSLAAQQIGSRSDLEQRELAFITSKNAWNSAVNTLQDTRERLRTELQVARNNAASTMAGNNDFVPRSLIDGRVYDLLIEPGELATPQRAIAVIGSATDLYLELEVDENDITRIKSGLDVMVTMDSYAGQVFKASITRVIPLMDDRSRTFRVEARFVTPPPSLFPNLTVEASIVLGSKTEALTIPASYVVDGAYVLTGPDERRAITIGARDMEKVEVLGGIEQGTVIYRP